MKKMMLVFLCLFVTACTVAMPWETTSIVPEKVHEGIYRGPHPDFEEIKKLPVTVIITLENNWDDVRKENSEAFANGFKLINYPMSELDAPTPEYLKTIARAVHENKSNGVYVHCRRGIDRTGYVVAAYRIIYDGWDYDKAYAEVKQHGHSSVFFADWKKSLKALTNDK